MFLGKFTPKFDDKGRFFLPPKFRDDLVDGLIVVRGQERCLSIYPLAAFQAMVERVTSASSSVQQVSDFRRMLAASASDSVPDKQGRVSVPANLRAYAGIDKDVVVNGALDHVELWNPETWAAYEQTQDTQFDDQLKQMVWV